MLSVNYGKLEILKTWLNTPIEKRKELLTYKESSLISMVNCINTSLVFAANESKKGSFEVLECIDTYWTEPIYMQIKPNFVKGLRLVNLLQDKHKQFLQGKKTLFLDQSEYSKIFDGEIKSWEDFQLAMCKIIEQAFLLAHYYKLKDLSDKATLEILQVDIKEKAQQQKKKQKSPVKKEKNWCDYESFCVEISSDKATDIDEKDADDLLFFDINTCGGKSHILRKYYSTVSLDWDPEVNEIINQAYYELHPFEYLSTCPVVRYYKTPAQYYFPQDNS